jgi:hypothetical protein
MLGVRIELSKIGVDVRAESPLGSILVRFLHVHDYRQPKFAINSRKFCSQLR